MVGQSGGEAQSLRKDAAQAVRCGVSSIRFGDPMQDAAEADALCAEMAKAADRFLAADVAPEDLAQLCCGMLEKAGKRSESKP